MNISIPSSTSLRRHLISTCHTLETVRHSSYVVPCFLVQPNAFKDISKKRNSILVSRFVLNVSLKEKRFLSCAPCRKLSLDSNRKRLKLFVTFSIQLRQLESSK